MTQLKISDLSVGDWVLNRKGFPTKVQVITSEGNMRCGEDAKPEHSVHIWITDVSPIPITPEILEKNGFVDYEVGKGWYVLNVADDLRVWLHRNSHDWTFQLMKWGPLSTHEIGKVFIKHIHQLQHALRLAGVEKEIVL